MLFVLAIILVLMPAVAPAQGPFAAMGGVGVGIADSSGDLLENPAAFSDVPADEGRLHAAVSWRNLTFSGRALNASRDTDAYFGVAAPLGLSIVTPLTGPGRVGIGVWQVNNRVLELDEPVDIGIPLVPGGSPLSSSYDGGVSRLRQYEGLFAAGAAWIQPFSNGEYQVSLGINAYNLTGRGLVDVNMVDAVDGDLVTVYRMASHRNLNSLGLSAGFFFRPMAEGSLGLNLTYIGSMTGHIWEQSEGGQVFKDEIGRPSQLRIGLGGSFVVIRGVLLALDLKLSSDARYEKVIFKGTPAERIYKETGASSFAIQGGAEYWVEYEGKSIPLRGGFFVEPDPLPSPIAGQGIAAVSDFRPVPFMQDVTGITVGTGCHLAGLRVDAALVWAMVNTRVKFEGATGPVESGDVKNTCGAVASLSFDLK